MNIQEAIELVAFSGRDVSSELKRVQTFIIRNIENEDTVPLVHDVVQHCTQDDPECKQRLVERMAPLLLAVSLNPKCTAQRRCQLFKATINIMRGMSKQVRVDFCEKHREILKALSELLKTVGDYEAQITITEILLRLVTSPAWAHEIFADKGLSETFFAISKQNFEPDVRTFINELNRNCGEEAKVWTYPCIAAEVGGHRVLKPSDEHYSDFWVDFNGGSKSILMFCQFDEDATELWNGLTIYEHDIIDIKLIPNKGVVTFELNLNREAYYLFDSATPDQFPGKVVKVTFRSKDPIDDCLAKIFPNIPLQAISRASMAHSLCLASCEQPTTPQKEASEKDEKKVDNAFPTKPMAALNEKPDPILETESSLEKSNAKEKKTYKKTGASKSSKNKVAKAKAVKSVCKTKAAKDTIKRPAKWTEKIEEKHIYDVDMSSNGDESDDEWKKGFLKRQEEREKQRQMLMAKTGPANADNAVTSTNAASSVQTLPTTVDKNSGKKSVSFEKTSKTEANMKPGKKSVSPKKPSKTEATIKKLVAVNDDSEEMDVQLVSQDSQSRIDKKLSPSKSVDKQQTHVASRNDDQAHHDGEEDEYGTPKSHVKKTPPRRIPVVPLTPPKRRRRDGPDLRSVKSAKIDSPPPSKKKRVSFEKDSEELISTPVLNNGRLALRRKTLNFEDESAPVDDNAAFTTAVSTDIINANQMSHMGDASTLAPEPSAAFLVRQVLDEFHAGKFQRLLQFEADQTQLFQEYEREMNQIKTDQFQKIFAVTSTLGLDLEAATAKLLRDFQQTVTSGRYTN